MKTEHFLIVEDVVVLDGDSQKYRRAPRPRRLVVAPESELREFIPRQRTTCLKERTFFAPRAEFPPKELISCPQDLIRIITRTSDPPHQESLSY